MTLYRWKERIDNGEIRTHLRDRPPEDKWDLEYLVDCKKVVHSSQVTTQELVDYLDSDAEGENYHRCVGLAETICHMVDNAAGKGLAGEMIGHKVLWKIVQAGGWPCLT